MTLLEAFEILDVSPDYSYDLIKANFKYLVKLYHPDNLETGNVYYFIQVIKAHLIIYNLYFN